MGNGALDYTYDVLNPGVAPDDQNADDLHTGGMKIVATQETVFNNFRVLEARTTPSSRDAIREYDLSLEFEYPFFGGTNADGDWLIRNLQGAGQPVVYANVGNNPSVMTLADAWIARLTLMYDNVADLTF